MSERDGNTATPLRLLGKRETVTARVTISRSFYGDRLVVEVRCGSFKTTMVVDDVEILDTRERPIETQLRDRAAKETEGTGK